MNFRYRNIIKRLTSESRPHEILRLVESVDKDRLKTEIKQQLGDGFITQADYDFIVKSATKLREVKELQTDLISLWDVTEPSQFPSLVKELSSKFVYPITHYWINNDLQEVEVSSYVPQKSDFIQMYGTEFELISTESVMWGKYEVR